MEVEVSPLPSADEIFRRACRHIVWKLGDAIGASRPQWMSGEWLVELWSPDGHERIGALYLDAHGEVILSKSSTHEMLIEAFHAPRAPFLATS